MAGHRFRCQLPHGRDQVAFRRYLPVAHGNKEEAIAIELQPRAVVTTSLRLRFKNLLDVRQPIVFETYPVGRLSTPDAFTDESVKYQVPSMSWSTTSYIWPAAANHVWKLPSRE